MNEKPYDVTETMADMDGGAFMQRVSKAVQDTAFAVSNQDDAEARKGKVTITFDLEKIKNSRQVHVSHDVAFAYPTARGKRTENHKTATPMHVGNRGALTLFPENQAEMFGKDRQTEGA